jgi:hypothetical protein
MMNPLRFAIGARRAMSGGGPSRGGGNTRASAGWPTSLMNPSNCIGAKPTSTRAGWGPPPMNVCGTPLGPNAKPPVVRSHRVSPTYNVKFPSST